MNKGSKKKELTAPIWFDAWTRQASARAERQRQVANALRVLSGVLILAGTLTLLVGVMWIDSMDICRANVVLGFGGMGIALVGAWIRWITEECI